MNLFTWLRAYFALMRAKAASASARRWGRLALRVADRLVKSDPTNEEYREFQRKAQAMAGQLRTTQAAINIELDRLDDYRR